MDGAVDPASIAMAISIGTPLLAGFVVMWIAMRSDKESAEGRDTATSVMFGFSLLLMLPLVASAVLVATSGMAYVGVVKAVLLFTAGFAVVGIAFGLVRGLRGGRAVRTAAGE